MPCGWPGQRWLGNPDANERLPGEATDNDFQSAIANDLRQHTYVYMCIFICIYIYIVIISVSALYLCLYWVSIQSIVFARIFCHAANFIFLVFWFPKTVRQASTWAEEPVGPDHPLCG